jgi:hypothetical protein
MTSLASVILHHSLASFPCPGALNACSLTVVLLRFVLLPTQICNWWESRIGKGSFTCKQDHVKSEDLKNAENSLCDLDLDVYSSQLCV